MNENWYALCISILKGVTPEMAFEMLDGKQLKQTGRINTTLTDEDIADMIKLKVDTSYREIGQIYGLSADAVYRRITRYKERCKGEVLCQI